MIFHSSSKFETSYDLVQYDLNRLHLWCRKNLLEVNASKTKVMFFSSKFLNTSSKPYKKLLLGNCELDYVDDYKYLGITIDSKISLTEHINKTISSVSHKASQLYKIRKSISPKTALQLYKTMILPIIDLCDLFYHNKSVKLTHNKLQVIQNRFLRIISNLSKLTNTLTEEYQLDLLPLCERRALHILQFAFEFVHSNSESLAYANHDEK